MTVYPKPDQSRKQPNFKRVGTLSIQSEKFATSSPAFRCDLCGAAVIEDDDGLKLHADWHRRLDFKAAFGWGATV